MQVFSREVENILTLVSRKLRATNRSTCCVLVRERDSVQAPVIPRMYCPSFRTSLSLALVLLLTEMTLNKTTEKLRQIGIEYVSFERTDT